MSNLPILRPKYPVNRRPQRETLTIRDAEITYRNFAGKKGMYNDEGERNFSVILDEALAQDLESKGWSVKPMKNYDDDGADQLYQLPIKVSFKFRPPRIYMVTGDGDRLPMRKQMMPESLLYMMDTLDLDACHMVVAASHWSQGGRSGKTAYLQSFFGHVYMDELEQEYATIEDIIEEDREENREADNQVIEGEFY